MKQYWILLPLAALAFARAAQASGGLVCGTAGPRPVEVAMVIGHTAVSSVVSARLRDNGRDIPAAVAQSWLEPGEVRLDLVDRNAARHELRLRARRNGSFFDGSMWRKGQRRWVRCREG
jgi:hypothetical protein